MDVSQFFKFREGTKDTLKEAGICVVSKLFYFFLKSPFVLWRMSSEHIKGMKAEAKLDIEKTEKPTPFLLFLIRYILEFLLHGLIYLSVAIAPFAALYVGIDSAIGIYGSAKTFFYGFFSTLAALYYAPVLIRLIIELIEIIKKYAPIIIKYVFFPITLIYHFLSYLSGKCKFKTLKYEKKSEAPSKE